MNSKFTTLSLFALILSASSIGVNAAALPDGTPLAGFPIVTSPPTRAVANATWTNLFLSGVTIPGAPRAAGGPITFGDAIRECGSGEGSKMWAMTFDDGPHPTNSRIVYDDLKTKNIPGTFYVIGGNMVTASMTGKRIVDEGHEIGLHTWSHPALTTLPNDQVVAELVWNAKAIYEVSGVVPRYLRPPYLDIDERVHAILKAMDIVPVLSNRDTNDFGMQYGGRTPEQLLSDLDGYVSQSANPNGVISLQHDFFEPAARVAPQVNAKISAAGYKIVKVSDCPNAAARGPAYATSGKFYELVTGYKDVASNPNANKAIYGGNSNSTNTGGNNAGNSNSTTKQPNSASSSSSTVGLVSMMAMTAMSFMLF